MSRIDTVLVLGAGASRDFRFPLGIDLLYSIEPEPSKTRYLTLAIR